MGEGSYDPFQAGPFVVGARTSQLVDAARGRQFPCELWYPSTQEIDTGGESRDAPALHDRVPLVLFSHLSGGHRRSSSFLCRHLAGHGYAVAALDHSEVVAPELAPPPRESPSARQARVAAVVASRVPDLRLAISHLLENEPLRKKFIQAGLTKAHDYAWPHVARCVMEYYSQLLEERATAMRIYPRAL